MVANRKPLGPAGRAFAHTQGMTFQMPLYRLLLAALPVFVTGFVSVSSAQVSCHQSYRELRIKSVYRESFKPLQEFGRSLMEMSKLLSDRQARTSEELIAQMSIVQAAAEAYFQSAGILFEREIGSANLKQIKDHPNFVLFYSYYRIQGTRDGDQLSRMLNGVLSHRATKASPPRFYFDPLFKLGYGAMKGFFDPARKVIALGPEALVMSTTGIAEVLRHELHHYFEALRIDRGEMSLQRLKLFDPEDQEGGYGKLLSADEAETHLRDLRAAKNKNRVEKIDEKLGSHLKSEELESIRGERQEIGEISSENLFSIVANSIKANSDLLQLGQRGDWKSIEREEQMDVDYAIFEMPGAEYPTAIVNLKGFATKQSSPSVLREAILKILNWNKTRLEQINQEIQKYKTNEKEDI